MIDHAQRIFYRMAFQLRYRRSTGNEFQSLFTDLMGRAYKADFQKVRAYGSKGDLKCDGYLSSEKAVFQCYAPRELKEVDTIKKINEDYEGAKVHWDSKMDQWVFVHNDQDGLPPGVVLHLETLKNSEKPREISWWSEAELLTILDKVALPDLIDLFGNQPTELQFEEIGFSQLQTVLTAISKSNPDPEPLINAPSLYKLSHNNLSQDTADFLRLGRKRERAVQDFLERWPEPSLGDQIAESFRSRYAALRAHGFSSNEIFVELLRFSRFNQGIDSSHNAAVLAVISYFFERCEIFEDPNGVVMST